MSNKDHHFRPTSLDNPGDWFIKNLKGHGRAVITVLNEKELREMFRDDPDEFSGMHCDSGEDGAKRLAYLTGNMNRLLVESIEINDGGHAVMCGTLVVSATTDTTEVWMLLEEIFQYA